MLITLSPAKTQDFKSTTQVAKTEPIFKDKIISLVKHLQQYSPEELASLLHISPKLAIMNFDRYQHFDPQHYTLDNSKAAIMAYQGDVYRGLDATSLKPADLEFAQEHLVMLSGLYGVLRPLDAMQAYRLEMGTALKTEAAVDLYAFWKKTITSYLSERLKTQKYLINLASQEYSKAIDTKALGAQCINIEFQDWNKDRFKIIGILAKRARGTMARFIIQNRLMKPEGLKKFNVDGYRFNTDLSSPNQYIFQRKKES